MGGLRGRVAGLVSRIRAFFSPPKRRPVAWIVGEETVPQVTPPRSFWGFFSGFASFWGRVRTRVFRVAAGLLALVDLSLAIILYSNVWYMNLILWLVTVPQFLILIHYLRLTKNG